MLIGFVVVLRILNNYRIKEQTKFLNNWESLIFSFLENDESPAVLISKIPRRKYKYLLNYLREFLLTLNGKDFERLASLINHTKITDFLLKKLKSHNKNKVIFASFFTGATGIEIAKPLLIKSIKNHDQQIFFSCSFALAKINAYDCLDLILHEFKKYNHFGNDYLLLILTEFDQKICVEIVKLLTVETSSSLATTFLRVLRYYKYKNAGQTVLQLLVYSHVKEVIIECLKFIEEIKFQKAAFAVSRLIEHKLPEVRSQAIKTISRLDNKSFEDKIFTKLFEDDYDVQYQAALAILYHYNDGEKRLADLAYSVNKGNSSAISRMLLSEKRVRDGK
ncbi:MAG: HEAT repeat domain-containing protein [Ignavibacteriaceae bacterium]